MQDEFRKPYTTLFNAITDALEALSSGQVLPAQDILIRAQKKAEEQYIACDSAN